MATTQNYNVYMAAIGERCIKVRARNIWEAAYKAAPQFSGRVTEGLRFFDGSAELEVIRLSGGKAIRGNYATWLNRFIAQGRNTKQWEAIHERAKPLSDPAQLGDSKSAFTPEQQQQLLNSFQKK